MAESDMPPASSATGSVVAYCHLQQPVALHVDLARWNLINSAHNFTLL